MPVTDQLFRFAWAESYANSAYHYSLFSVGTQVVSGRVF